MLSSIPLTRIIMLANVLVVTMAVVVLLTLPTPPARPGASASGGPTRGPSQPPQPSASPTPDPSLPSAELPPPITASPEFARQVKANEAGMVPILMYHRITHRRLASIDRTPDQVRKELERLARDGYVPVTAREFATGRMDVPAGKHPVVLTFDDGHHSHFALQADGTPARNSAVGIIYQVARKYPGFRPVATFWVNRYPFGLQERRDQERAVRWLVERGFEVANHTWSHPYLPGLGKKEIAGQLARVERMLKRLGVPPSETMALPFGAMPRKRATVQSGKWQGVPYRFKGVFLAGAEPSVSPFVRRYDHRSIQRIQSNGKKGECRKWCSQYWLEWLDRHPRERYTADGDPDRISVPRGLRGKIRSDRKQLINAY
ncbi:polysaccharide deacetylase family protein [Streptosporangium sp. NPDC050855]|uniref:polysaccharide deacetylase family protein n=1 Tax=Streptosporangium sp. NPDC050855 TaxID=3366194 RepID=UPI0037AAC569